MLRIQKDICQSAARDFLWKDKSMDTVCSSFSLYFLILL